MSPQPTEAALRQAYARAELARVGISYQRAMQTPHLRTALTDCALAALRKAEAATAPSKPPEPRPGPRLQFYLSMQFKSKQDQED